MQGVPYLVIAGSQQLMLSDTYPGMPLQETFFSPAYGQAVDKFGVFFQVNAPPAKA